jgi:hypothetical protein
MVEVVAIGVASTVDVKSGATVEVGSPERSVDVAVLATSVRLGVSSGSVGEGLRVSVAGGGDTLSVSSGESVEDSAGLRIPGVSVTASGSAFTAGFIAHPRRSMRRRIAPSIKLTISLNRSSLGALARSMISPIPACKIACLL